MRRLRSRKKRAQLYLDHEGRCAICGAKLVRGWHADHKIPYVITRCTEYANMQPVCPLCNLEKGDEVVRDSTYYESLNLGKHVNINPFRLGQKGAFNCIIERVLEGEKTISVMLPTRYGKSDLMRVSAIELIERKAINGCLVVAPCTVLRDQMAEGKKMLEMQNRYGLNRLNRPIRADVLESWGRFPIFQNKETFIAMTTQMLSHNAEQLCDYMEREHVKVTGKPWLVFIDEVHSASEENTWGATVPQINAAGGIVVLCTGTPYREDGLNIPGFTMETRGPERETTVKVPRKHPTDEDKQMMNTYRKIECKKRLVADYEYGYDRAWAEGKNLDDSPSGKDVICRMVRSQFDVGINLTGEPDGKEVKISGMATTQSRTMLGKWVKNPKVIAAGVKASLRNLLDLRKDEPAAQAIVFCGNDLSEDTDDGHAKKIAEEFYRQDHSLEVIIATCNKDNPDALIKSFGKGHGDILIVKQMASLGLDIAAIKVVLDLSSVRTMTAYIQRMMRAATVWETATGKNIVAYYVTPQDVISTALWEGFVAGNGGEYNSCKTELIDSEEVDKPDDNDDRKDPVVVRTYDAVVSDSDGAEASDADDYENFVKPLIDAFPVLIKSYTHNEIAYRGKEASAALGISDLKKLSNPLQTPIAPPRNIADERNALRKEINDLSGAIANKFHPYNPKKSAVENEPNIARRQRTFVDAKKRAGVVGAMKLQFIVKIEQLEIMRNYLQDTLLQLTQ